MTWSGFISYLICIVGGFFLGGIMFSQIIPQLTANKDIAAISDDHNPGATNVFVNCGPKLGLICLSLDIAKGFVPAFLACNLLSTDHMLFGLALAAPVLGHAIAPLYHFHGGKCIATAFGVMLGMFPTNHAGLIILAGLYIFFSTVCKIQPNRIRSIVTFGLFGLISGALMIHQGLYSMALGCVLIALTAMIKHSSYFCR